MGKKKGKEMEQNKVVVPFKDTKEVVTLGINLGKVIEAMLKDGKIEVTDFIKPEVLANLYATILVIKPALEDISNVGLDFAVASPEEKADFEAWVKEQVNLENKTIEQFIEATFALVLDFAFFLKMFFPHTLTVAEENNGQAEPQAEQTESAE